MKMELSNRAKNILGFMIIETQLSFYFLWRAFKLPADTPLLSGAMFELVLAVILISIIGGIIVTVIVNGTKNKEAADERDKNIERQADSFAYRTLVWSIICFLIFLYVSQGMEIGELPGQFEKALIVFSFTPLRVLMAMIFIMWVSETAKYATQLRLYGRGL
jgi:hypothetical protein